MSKTTPVTAPKPLRPRKPKQTVLLPTPARSEVLPVDDKPPPSERMAFSFWGIRAEAEGLQAIKSIVQVILIAMGCVMVALFFLKLF